MRTNIYLDEDQVARLDQRARQEGLSRAALIRRILEDGLSVDDTSLAADLAALRESFGAAADLDLTRAVDARGAHLDRIRQM